MCYRYVRIKRNGDGVTSEVSLNVNAQVYKEVFSAIAQRERRCRGSSADSQYSYLFLN